MHIRIYFLLLALFFGLFFSAACGSGDVGIACTSNSECQSNQFCKDSVCTLAECSEQDACSDGKACKEQQCVLCTTDESCGSGKICEKDTCLESTCSSEKPCTDGKLCKKGRCAACTKKEECKAGQVCKEGSCKKGCADDDGCEKGNICKAERCEIGCRKKDQCTSDQICKNDICVIGCEADESCKKNQICEEQQCVSGCRKDEACTKGQICEKKKCSAGCRDNAGCEAQQKCDAKKKRCVECLKSEDCAAGEICRKQVCEPCAKDIQCSKGQLCLSGACKIANCRASDGCKDGKVCTKNLCQACTEDKMCAKGQICAKDKCKAGCRKTQHCAAKQLCDPKTLLCKGCLKKGDCIGGQICKSGICIACTQDSSCDKGELCLNGGCKKASCRASKDCSGGKICRRNICDNCSLDKECQTGELCLLGICKKASCRTSKDCTTGKVCTKNTCSSCQKDTECASGKLCLSGSCKTANCHKASDCKGGQICTNNQCALCKKNTDCAQGQICQLGSCRIGNCKVDKDCKSGQRCRNFECSACQKDTDCTRAQLCLSGACKIANCRKVSDCKSGQICSKNICSKCNTDKDCSSKQLCLSGACKIANCRKVSDCKNGQICLKNTCSQCSTDKNCGTGRLCLQGVCKVGNCHHSGHCPSGKVCKSNTCSACANTKDCGSGKVCVSGSCKVGNCLSGKDCQKGKACINNQCGSCKNHADCGIDGLCTKGTCIETIVLHQGVYRWKDGSHANTCLGYRYPDRLHQTALQNGFYWLQPNTQKPAFKAYCDMKTDGGGWTRCLLQTMPANSKNRLSVGRNISQVRSDKPLPPLSWIAQQCGGPSGEEFLIRGNRENKVGFAVRGLANASMFANSTGNNCYDVVDLQRNHIKRRLAVFRNGTYSGTVCGFGGTSTRSLWLNRPNSIPGNGHLEYTFHGADHFRRIGTTDNNDTKLKSIEIYRRGKVPGKSIVFYKGARRRADGGSERSCAAYQFSPKYTGTIGDGVYWIQPDASTPAFKVLCDMTNDGGGWTLIAKYSTSLKLAGFNHTKHQQQNSATGKTLSAAPDLTQSNVFGHIAYTNFPIQDRGLRLECGSSINSLHKIKHSKTFKNWRIGDHNTYGNTKGWGILGQFDVWQRANHYICGARTQKSASSWYSGIAYCQGLGLSGSWRSHQVSFSFTKPSGRLVMGCKKKGQSGIGRVWVRGITSPQELSLFKGAYRWVDGSYAKDCKTYRFPTNGKAAAQRDGEYWIKPTSASAVRVTCNMTLDGGGWTVIAHAVNEKYSTPPIPAGNGKAGTWKQWAAHSWRSNNSYYLSLNTFDALTHAKTTLRQVNRNAQGKLIRIAEYANYNYDANKNKSTIGKGCKDIIGKPCSGRYTWSKFPPSFDGWGRSNTCNTRYSNKVWNYHNFSNCASDSALFTWCNCSTPRPSLLGSYQKSTHENLIMVR